MTSGNFYFFIFAYFGKNFLLKIFQHASHNPTERFWTVPFFIANSTRKWFSLEKWYYESSHCSFITKSVRHAKFCMSPFETCLLNKASYVGLCKLLLVEWSIHSLEYRPRPQIKRFITLIFKWNRGEWEGKGESQNGEI